MRVYERLYYRAGTVFETNIDLTTRTVFITGDLEEDSIDKAIKGILMLDSIQDQGDNTITIIINTLGGDEHSMFALYDCIRNCKSVIKTIGIGKVMSAGPLLLAAGDKGHRFAFENVRIMLHHGSAAFEGKKMDIMSDLKEMKVMDKMWIAAMEENTNKDSNFWKKITEDNPVDYYIDAETAKKFGMIDDIISPKK